MSSTSYWQFIHFSWRLHTIRLGLHHCQNECWRLKTKNENWRASRSFGLPTISMLSKLFPWFITISFYHCLHFFNWCMSVILFDISTQVGVCCEKLTVRRCVRRETENEETFSFVQSHYCVWSPRESYLGSKAVFTNFWQPVLKTFLYIWSVDRTEGTRCYWVASLRHIYTLYYKKTSAII